MLNSMKFKNIGELYETTRKIRSGATKAAKRDYYAYLTAMRKVKNRRAFDIILTCQNRLKNAKPHKK